MTEDIEEHEHDSGPWDRHRGRYIKKTLKIHGQSLAAWARKLAEQDAQLIHMAISTGLSAGEDHTDIAHRVVGSRRLKGGNGVTEITRKHIQYLGAALLHKRKSRMSGQSSS